MKKPYLPTFLVLIALLLSACSDRELRQQLDLAEAQVTINADSTLSILNAIEQERLSRPEDAARWGLLSTWALYRKYVKEIPEEPLLTAFEYYRESKDPLRRAQVYYLHSVVQEDQHRGEPHEWLEDLYRASLSIGETDDHVLAAQIYQRYEDKLYKKHQYSEAVLWGEKFLQEARLSNSIHEELLAMTNLSLTTFYAEVQRVSDSLKCDEAAIVTKAGNFQPAFDILYQALGKARALNLRKREGKLCGNLSSYHTMTQRPDSALYYALLAKDIDEELFAQGKSTEPINYLHVAEAYRKNNQADSAIHYALKTMQSPGMTTRRNAANTLILVYRDMKQDYKKAMEWMKVHKAIEDSIQQRINDEQVGAAQDAVKSEIEKNVIEKQKDDAMGWLFWCILISTLIIAVVVCHMVQNRFRFQARLKEQEEEFNRLLAERRANVQQPVTPQPAPTPQPDNDTAASATPATEADEADNQTVISEQQPAPQKNLLLTGSTKEQLSIAPETVLFLTSESNYIKVYYLSPEGKVQSKMLRQTMGRLEEQLAPFDSIVRCHRAFFVNLQHVVHASSVPTGLQLSLDASTATIPVSRTYIADIKKWLEGS